MKKIIRKIRQLIGTILSFFRFNSIYWMYPIPLNKYDIRDYYYRFKHPKTLSHIKIVGSPSDKERDPLWDRGLEIPDGWNKLFDQYLKILEKHNCTVAQAKEKFGRLTVYFNLNNYTNEKYIEIIEELRPIVEKSMETCVKCGKPGELTKRGWIQPLCPKHMKEKYK